VAIQERRFAANFRIADDEPEVALCGVDNKPARAALEDVGLRRVIEAGLGQGSREYLAFQVHGFPARKSASERWSGPEPARSTEALVANRAYRSLEAEGLDQCGLTTLAGRSVGASFVGAVVSTLVVAELLRWTLEERRYEVIDGSLASLSNRQAFASDLQLDPLNPGVTTAIPCAQR
jgi:hypothetical protein